MLLTNQTRFPAAIARMVYGDDKIASSVLVRVLYERRQGAFVPAEEQPWSVSMTPWEGPKGTMDGDLVFYKDGVDIFLFGTATAPNEKPITEMDVAIKLSGGFERSVRIFGPRVWARKIGKLVPTPPRPFSTLPLTLRHAFGGTDTYDGLQVAWPENPDGTGFYVAEEQAVDKPLPCIEEADSLITKWDDRPPPAGLVSLPVGSPVRAKQGLAIEGQRSKLTPRYFNAAFARMIAKEVDLGSTAAVSGVSAKGPLVFPLPSHRFFIRLRFSQETHELPLKIDQVALLTDEDRLMIAYRAPFRYIVRPMEERECVLFEATEGKP